MSKKLKKPRFILRKAFLQDLDTRDTYTLTWSSKNKIHGLDSMIRIGLHGLPGYKKMLIENAKKSMTEYLKAIRDELNGLDLGN